MSAAGVLSGVAPAESDEELVSEPQAVAPRASSMSARAGSERSTGNPLRANRETRAAILSGRRSAPRPREQIRERVDRVRPVGVPAVGPDLEVQVRAVRAAGVANGGELLT